MERSSQEKGAPSSPLLLALFGWCYSTEGHEAELLLVNAVQGTVCVCSCPRAPQSLGIGCEDGTVITLPRLLYGYTWESGKRCSDEDTEGTNSPARPAGSDSGNLLQLPALCNPVRVSRATGAAPRPWGSVGPPWGEVDEGILPHPLHWARAFPASGQLQFPPS